MEKRYELRCTDEMLSAWKAAAGRVPLSAWIRDVLNAAASVPSDVFAGPAARLRASGAVVAAYDEDGVVHPVPMLDAVAVEGAKIGRPMVPAPFKPDFGKRLKPS